MGHEVKNDVDAERIRDFLGELSEILLVLSLAFPAIADVAVVNGENHHPLVIVEDGADVHFFGTLAAENGLQLGARVIRIVILIPKLNGGDLQPIHWAAEIVNAIEDGMIGGQIGPGSVGQHPFDLTGKAIL